MKIKFIPLSGAIQTITSLSRGRIFPETFRSIHLLIRSRYFQLDLPTSKTSVPLDRSVSITSIDYVLSIPFHPITYWLWQCQLWDNWEMLISVQANHCKVLHRTWLEHHIHEWPLLYTCSHLRSNFTDCSECSILHGSNNKCDATITPADKCDNVGHMASYHYCGTFGPTLSQLHVVQWKPHPAPKNQSINQ